ncbi:PhzF family phenazine biosynthesis protein [Ralstonia pickettii]|nr:PhzF family phenazine biosynthesis protein [Ralstonia pickettii]
MTGPDELIAPEPLSLRSAVSIESVAACLSLYSDDIHSQVHAPRVASVGLPFLIVELATRDALRRCAPNPVAYKAILPLDGAVSIYAYTWDVSESDAKAGCDLQARMFTGRMTEDPATGSATAAMVALLASVRAVPKLALTVRQGVDMGRPSTLFASYEQTDTAAMVRVGGNCVSVMEGTFWLPPA